MAAKYRKIDPRIWDDEVFDTLDCHEAIVILWILTSNAVNRCGIAVFSLGQLSDKCRLQGVDHAWDTLSTGCNRLSWPVQKTSRNTVVVVLPNWFRYNTPTNQDHLKGCMTDLSDVPRCEVVSSSLERIRDGLKGDFLKTWDTSLTGCLPSLGQGVGVGVTQEQKQKQEQEQEQKQEQKREQEQKSDSSESAIAAPEPLTEFVFLTVGTKQKEWTLPSSLLSVLSEAFPGVDVPAECRKAAAWCVTNATNRKTPHGMPKFLNSWMSRQQNSHSKSASNDDPLGTKALFEKRNRDRENNPTEE